jgi:uncharacterized protein (TIGR03118 family)
VTNIILDGFVPATVTDPSFIDPWGVSGGDSLWIDTNATGFSYVNSIAGAIDFKSTIPSASGSGTGQPTGTVQNTTNGFVLSNGAPGSFLFATSDGTISGWNTAQGPPAYSALIEVNNSSQNAVYTDLAMVTNNSGTFLLVPNFGQGGDVEVYNSNFQQTTLAGTFTDPNIPAGYAPYSIKVLGTGSNTQVFIAYTLRTTPPFPAGAGSYQEILGTNTGFVSVFDVNGNFIARAVTGGNLNAPWGVAIAPAGFGAFGGDLLIGNFGDGLITAYNPTTFAYLGMLSDSTGKPLSYPGLWDIFVSTASAAVPNSIYFTAGLANQTHGLFGVISSAASGNGSFTLSASSQVATVAAGSSTTLTISVAPSNNFSGTVTLACSGLPVNATCVFSNPQLTVSSTPVTTSLTIQAASASTGGGGTSSGGYFRTALRENGSLHGFGIATALLLPFGSLLAFRRRRSLASLRVLGVLVIFVATASLIVGCGSSGSNPSGTIPAIPPAGTSNVTITATSGNIVQSTVIALTVQ